MADRPNLSDPGRIVAHRGASQVTPENTLGAFRTARAQGCHWVEFDVSLLGDGTPVVHHDNTLDRCTNANGPLAAIGASDLETIEAGPGEPLPTLAEALDLLGDLGFHANLEMKPHALSPGLTTAAVVRELAARPWTSERVLISSFSVEELAAFREVMPDAPLAVIYHNPPDDWPETLTGLRAAALHMRYTFLDKRLLETAQREGFDLRVFTINDAELLVPYRDLGLTGVITDDPPLFLEDEGWRRWSEG